MSNKIKVRWEIEDGYMGGSRPQSFSIDLGEMVDSCQDEDEARRYLEEELDSALQERVSWVCPNFDEVIEAWRNAQAKAE